jgi:integrase
MIKYIKLNSLRAIYSEVKCASALVSGQWGRKWVKASLGHASVKTTERYVKFAGDALMAAAKEMNG